MERKAISQRKCKKTIPWADALILVGVQWSKRLVVDGRLSQEVLTCLPAGERGKECLWEFLGHHIPGPEKGARCGPGGRGKHVSATSPPSSPRFQQSKLAPTAASFYPERPPIWRELVLDCQGQLTVPVTLPNWKRIRVRFFFHLYPLLDLKHVWTRNVADLVATGTHANRWQFLWPGCFLLPQRLVSGGDQAASACHFQYRVVT